ncbi:MAG: META domain-containing protein [Patescibacteria group bacterium]
MKKSTFVVSLVFLILIIGVIWLAYYPKKAVAPTPQTGESIKNATYSIDGRSVTLVNGISEIPAAPQSATKITTRYFGNEVTGDFNADGRVDTAFILTQNTGGSGTFYYVVVALNTKDGYIGSQALLLGDRIAPQTTEIGNNTILVVNYADRKPGESFATPPSVGKSIWLKFDSNTMQFGEVVQNFEGESDPARMTLNMQPWTWIRTVYSNDTTLVARDPSKFKITFEKNKKFSIMTDCNTGGGTYTVSGNKIVFTEMVSTLMYCEGSQEQDFVKMLNQVQSYHFTTKGELVFDLKADSGSMIFR